MSCRPVDAGAGAFWRCSSSRQPLRVQLRLGAVPAPPALPRRATADLGVAATLVRPGRRRRLGWVEPGASGRTETCAARWPLPPPPRTWLHRRCARPPSTRRSRWAPRRRAAASGSGSSGRRWSPRPVPGAGTSSSATPIRPRRVGACPWFRGQWPPPPGGPAGRNARPRDRRRSQVGRSRRQPRRRARSQPPRWCAAGSSTPRRVVGRRKRSAPGRERV
jgi:hypothetical protein